MLVSSEKLDRGRAGGASSARTSCSSATPPTPTIRASSGCSGERAEDGRVRAARRRQPERSRARRVGRRARGRRLLTPSSASPRARTRPAQRLARLVITEAIARAPWSWRLLRRPVTRFFDRSRPAGTSAWRATRNGSRRSPPRSDLSPAAPSGCSTSGPALVRRALVAADRYPEAEVLGIDVSPEMIETAAGEERRSRASGSRSRTSPSFTRRGIRPGDHDQHARSSSRCPRSCARAATSSRSPRAGHDALLHAGGNAGSEASSGKASSTVAAATRRHLLPRRAPVSERPHFTILMNPASAGGKPQRLLPEVRSCWARRAPRRASSRPGTCRTPPTPPGPRPSRGEIVVALGGDGLVGALAGALRRARRRSACCRAGAATTSRAPSASPRTSAAPAACCSTGERKALDLGEANGRRSRASPRSASTPTRTGSPTRRSSCAATSSTPTRRSAR